MDVFSVPSDPDDLPSFSALLESSQSSVASPLGKDSGTSFSTAGGLLSPSDDSEAGEGEAALLRSKRRKLEEIPSRERWRCPHEGCGREYKRTSTTSIGQHKERCPKRPVLLARPLFQLNSTVHRVGFPTSGAGIGAQASPVGRVDSSGLTSAVNAQTQAALLQVQQQLQQQTQQQLQAQLLQQQQALLQQQQRQIAANQGALGSNLRVPNQNYMTPGFEPASLPYNPLVTMTLSALNEQLMGLSSRSLSSPIRTTAGGGLGQGGLSQSSSPQPFRPIPTQSLYSSQQSSGLSQPASPYYDISVGSSFPNYGLNAQLLSELPMSSSGPASSSSSYQSPAMPLSPPTPLPLTVLSLMKPVARRMEDGTAVAGGMMSHLPPPSLQHFRQFSWA